MKRAMFIVNGERVVSLSKLINDTIYHLSGPEDTSDDDAADWCGACIKDTEAFWNEKFPDQVFLIDATLHHQCDECNTYYPHHL